MDDAIGFISRLIVFVKNTLMGFKGLFTVMDVLDKITVSRSVVVARFWQKHP